MKIFKIYQNTNSNYDTYDSSVVYANDEEEAKRIHPDGSENTNESDDEKDRRFGTWTGIKNVKVKYVGENPNIEKKGVIVSSFNAG